MYIYSTGNQKITRKKKQVHVLTTNYLSISCIFQITWCGQVFTEPGTVLCTLISQTLAHLDPSLSSCITEFIKNESNIIAKLIELRQVTVHLYNLNLAVKEKFNTKISNNLCQ